MRDNKKHMKRAYILLVLATALTVSPLVSAEGLQPIVLSSAQLALIRANCVSIRSSLQRLHENDALARVNLGREYETISNKLMAPMNSRIALNKLDGVMAAKTTVEFDDDLATFRSSYQRYEESVARTINIDCQERPVDFYQMIEYARMYRAEVRQTVMRMSELIKKYRMQIDTIHQTSDKKHAGAK